MGFMEDFLTRLKASGKAGASGASAIEQVSADLLEEAIKQRHEAGKPTAYGYARVSHRDSVASGVSFETQEAWIRKYVAMLQETRRPDLVWGEMFVDKAVSALTTDLVDRPAGKRLNQKLKRGDLVVCYHIDRAFRNTRDCLMTLDMIWEPKGIELAFIEPTIDTSCPYGRFMLQVFVSAAELDSKIKSLKNKAISANLKERGYAFRPPPWGFKNVGPKGRKRVVPDEKQRDVGRLVLYLRDVEELTFAQIARPAADLESTQTGRVPDLMKWNEDKTRFVYHKAKELGLDARDTRRRVPA